jgi:hypothetical protein
LLLLTPFLAHAGDCAAAQDLQQNVTAGLFYKALVMQAGKPLSCRVDVDGAKTTITYSFKKHAELRAEVDQTIEASEQRIKTRMPMANAIQLLKDAEKDLYPPGGCGIAWDHPQSSSGETVYRGTTCNCQARVTGRGNYAVTLILRSAC